MRLRGPNLSRSGPSESRVTPPFPLLSRRLEKRPRFGGIAPAVYEIRRFRPAPPKPAMPAGAARHIRRWSTAPGPPHQIRRCLRELNPSPRRPPRPPRRRDHPRHRRPRRPGWERSRGEADESDCSAWLKHFLSPRVQRSSEVLCSSGRSLGSISRGFAKGVGVAGEGLVGSTHPAHAPAGPVRYLAPREPLAAKLNNLIAVKDG